MGETPQAPPSATSAPATPAGRGIGWLVGVGFVAVMAIAGFLAVRFELIPFGAPKKAPVVEPQKMVVRYVLAAPLDPSQRPPGAVYIAEVRGDNELLLSFEVGGVVDQIGPSPSKNWDPGTTVAAGAVLGRLKQDDYLDRVMPPKPRRTRAKTHERMENLYKTNTIPKQKFDQATADLKTAEADLAASEQALKNTVLRAPEEGTILDRMVSAAETVGPGRSVIRFSNLKRMSVEVGVPDTAISQVKLGQDVPVVVSALAGQTFTGRVTQVAVAGEQGTRLFKVRIKVPNPSGFIKSGMTASVSFVPLGGLPKNAVWVPLASLTAAKDAPGRLAVYVIGADGRVVKRPVQTDEIAGNRIMISKGLKAGDKVVVVGVSTLYDGALVDARPALEGFN